MSESLRLTELVAKERQGDVAILVGIAATVGERVHRTDIVVGSRVVEC